MDPQARHRTLQLLGIAEERAYYGALPGQRVPEGFKGGGQFKSPARALIRLVKDWLTGDRRGDPLAGQSEAVIRTVAREIGLDPPAGMNPVVLKSLIVARLDTPAPRAPETDPEPDVELDDGLPELTEHVAQWHTDTADLEPLMDSVRSGATPVGPLLFGRRSRTGLVDFGDGTEGAVTTYTDERDADADQLAGTLARAIGIPSPRILRMAPDRTVAELVDGPTWAEREAQILNDPRAYELETESPQQTKFQDVPELATATRLQQQDLVRQRTRMLATPAARRLGVLDLLADVDTRDPGTVVLGPDGVVPVQNETAWSTPLPESAVPDRHRVVVADIKAPGGFRIEGVVTATPAPSADEDGLSFWAAFVRNGAWINNPLSAGDISYLRAKLAGLRSQFEQLGRLQWWENAVARLEALAQFARGTDDLFTE